MVKKGFTLLELLIVISIIGILVAVAAASYSSSQKKARNSRRMSDMKNVQNAAEQYYADNNFAYPGNTSFGFTYLPAGWPNDPKPSNPDYQYTIPQIGPVVSYTVCAQMEGEVGNSSSNTGGSFGTCDPDRDNCIYYCVKNLQ